MAGVLIYNGREIYSNTPQKGLALLYRACFRGYNKYRSIERITIIHTENKIDIQPRFLPESLEKLIRQQLSKPGNLQHLNRTILFNYEAGITRFINAGTNTKFAIFSVHSYLMDWGAEDWFGSEEDSVLDKLYQNATGAKSLSRYIKDVFCQDYEETTESPEIHEDRPAPKTANSPTSLPFIACLVAKLGYLSPEEAMIYIKNTVLLQHKKNYFGTKLPAYAISLFLNANLGRFTHIFSTLCMHYMQGLTFWKHDPFLLSHVLNTQTLRTQFFQQCVLSNINLIPILQCDPALQASYQVDQNRLDHLWSLAQTDKKFFLPIEAIMPIISRLKQIFDEDVYHTKKRHNLNDVLSKLDILSCSAIPTELLVYETSWVNLIEKDDAWINVPSNTPYCENIYRLGLEEKSAAIRQKLLVHHIAGAIEKCKHSWGYAFQYIPEISALISRTEFFKIYLQHQDEVPNDEAIQFLGYYFKAKKETVGSDEENEVRIELSRLHKALGHSEQGTLSLIQNQGTLSPSNSDVTATAAAFGLFKARATHPI